MWTPIDGRGLSIAEHLVHVQGMKFDQGFKPIGMTLHNTAAPKLSQWNSSTAAQRIRNLENYYKNEQGWPSGPHAFVDDQKIWLFTPYNKKGTHSPSWNGTRIGIEMVGDFDTEDPNSGRGELVKKNTVALFAHLHEKMGWDPETIKLHKEDPRTTHACPGRNIDKASFINMVQEYMGHGGEHAPEPATPPAPKKVGLVNVAANDTLNMRSQSSASSSVIMALQPGSTVEILSEAMNGTTKWFRVKFGGIIGWVAARYIIVRN